jgi:phage terminase large subunit-like protein
LQSPSIENALGRLQRIVWEMKRRNLEERIRFWEPQKPPENDQEAAYLSLAHVLYVGGGVRSGKTELAVAKGIKYCTGEHPTLSPLRKPPIYGRFVGTTWEHGIRLILKKFQSMVRRDDLYGGSWETAWSEKGGKLSFCLDKRKTIKGSSISFLTSQQHVDAHRGDDLDFVVMDEHHEQKYYTENISRLVDRNGWIMLTMTPEAGMTWEDREILEKVRTGHPDFRLWVFDSRKNRYLSSEGLALLIESVRGYPELFDTKVRGLMVALSGLVYPMFKREVHVIDDENVPVKKFIHRQVLLDMHLKKAAALLWTGWTKDGDLYCHRTARWKPRSAGIEDLASVIRIKSAGEKINDWIIDEALGGDPNKQERNAFGEKDIIVQLNDLGLPFVGTNVASDKNVQAGILKLQRFLRVDPVSGRPRLYVARSCYDLIREFEIYQFRKLTAVDDESYRERLRNIEDDIVTLVRYAVMAEPTWNLPEQTPELYDPESGMPVGPGYRQPAGEYQDDRPFGDEELN